jgi:type IV pilus assembly protein PilA
MRTKEQGFTLIEVMIVVAIVGVLAATAIPLFAAHLKKAKVTDAHLHLNVIAKSAKTYYQTNAKYPIGSAAVLPAADGSACAGSARGTNGKKLAVTDAWTADPMWSDLDFRITEETYFSYHYTGSQTTATALAVADLDCDGALGTYTLDLTAPNGTPAARIIEPATPD